MIQRMKGDNNNNGGQWLLELIGIVLLLGFMALCLYIYYLSRKNGY